MFTNMVGRIKLEESVGNTQVDDIDPITAADPEFAEATTEYEKQELLAQVLKVSTPNVALLKLAGSYGYMSSASVESLSIGMNTIQWEAAVEGVMDNLKEKISSIASSVAAKVSQFYNWVKAKFNSIFSKADEAEKELQSVSSLTDQEIKEIHDTIESPTATIIIEELKAIGKMIVKWPVMLMSISTAIFTGAVVFTRAATTAHEFKVIINNQRASANMDALARSGYGWIYDVNMKAIRYVSAAAYSTKKSISQHGFTKGILQSIIKLFKSFKIGEAFRSISFDKMISAARATGNVTVGGIIGLGRLIAGFWRMPIMSLVLIITSIFAVLRICKRIKNAKSETAEA